MDARPSTTPSSRHVFTTKKKTDAERGRPTEPAATQSNEATPTVNVKRPRPKSAVNKTNGDSPAPKDDHVDDSAQKNTDNSKRIPKTSGNATDVSKSRPAQPKNKPKASDSRPDVPRGRHMASSDKPEGLVHDSSASSKLFISQHRQNHPQQQPVNDQVRKSREPVGRPQPKNESASFDTEFQQLLIKFPDMTLCDAAHSNGRQVRLRVPILDPDFPYDLEAIDLCIMVPTMYPQERPQVRLVNDKVIPPSYRIMVEQRLAAYVHALPANELCLRPIIRYLENNFEQLVTERAASSRFKFFRPQPRVPSNSGTTPPSIAESADLTTPCSSSSRNGPSQGASLEVEEEFIAFSGSPPPASNKRDDDLVWQEAGPLLLENTSKSDVRGEDYFVDLVALQMQNVAYGYARAVTLSVRCSRCQSQFTVGPLRAFVDRFEQCPRCTCKVPALWQPCLVHAHSQRLGRLTMGRAVPQDWLPSPLQLACFQCPQPEQHCLGEWTPSVRIAGNRFPQCQHAFTLSSQQIQFIKSAPFLDPKRPKGRKGVEEEGGPLKIGQPLPGKGACEHFQKSFRWYRFPCCHRAFACEHCHLRGSPKCASLDPADCIATKFLCGFCSREQSLASAKTCVCGHDWSGGAGPRHSAHWEGGRGCRNALTMSRKDSHKHKRHP